jgi:hypothetical protein
MRRLLAALILVLAGAACAPSTSSSSRPPCADRVATAFTKGTLVRHSFDCLTPELMAALAAGGIGSDEQFAAHTKAVMPPVSELDYVGRMDGAYVYVAHVKGGTIDVILWTDKHGNVENVDLTGRNI